MICLDAPTVFVDSEQTGALSAAVSCTRVLPSIAHLVKKCVPMVKLGQVTRTDHIIRLQKMFEVGSQPHNFPDCFQNFKIR